MNNKKVLKDRIVKSIFNAIEEVNPQLPDGQKLGKNANIDLYGNQGKLDSLGLINLVVAVEQSIEDEFGTTITLVDERAMSQKNSPFRTVKSLADYIKILLEEEIEG